ncbi:MAG: ATP-binding cassette domain-containing protein [Acutalibacteraceae bacterium]
MIITRNLTKLFDRYEAVSNLSLEIQSGCIYGLVGTNGAGKSTLLRTLAGIYRPSSGEALLDDQSHFRPCPCQIPDRTGPR